MSDDLVKRLRGWARDIREGSTAIWAMDQDLKEAADRIEDLEAKLEKAAVALDKIKRIDNLVGVFAACERTLAEITEEQRR